jgi:hypothetical protein
VYAHHGRTELDVDSDRLCFEKHTVAIDAEPFETQPLQGLGVLHLQADLLEDPLRQLVHPGCLAPRSALGKRGGAAQYQSRPDS